MASPTPSTSSATNAPTKQQEQITFRFCRECSNMLYPKEDRMTNKLMFACRTCQFSEEAQSSCVFRNNMYNTVGETAGVTQDVGSDPTVGDVSSDLGSDAVVGSSVVPGGGGEDGEGFVCTYCGREVGEEWVELCVGEWGVERVGEGEGKGEGQGGVFDLGEMSFMEEEDMDMDGESDNGVMNDGDDQGGEDSQSHSESPSRKSS